MSVPQVEASNSNNAVGQGEISAIAFLDGIATALVEWEVSLPSVCEILSL